MKRLITGLAIAALTATGATSAVLAATWDMPTPYGDSNFHTVNIKQFAADVDKATGGALQIKVHAGGSLFKHPEIKNAVRGGQVPIGEFLLSRLSNENVVFGVDSVPFMASNYDAAKKLWGASRDAVEKLLDKQGLMVLFAVPWPPQGIYAKKPLNSMDDLKGVKFRAYNVATETIAKMAGAVPTQVEVPDIPQAFATGRVDAMITSPSTGANSKAWDFLSHYYDTQAWLPKNITVVNKKAFRSLDQKTRDAVLATARKAEERGWQASKEETATKTAILKKNGISVNSPSAALSAGFAKIGAKMTADWAAKAGAEGDAILKAFGK